jgi:hypothetical protein
MRASPGQLTDAQLTRLALQTRVELAALLVLQDVLLSGIHAAFWLVGLEQIQELDISGGTGTDAAAAAAADVVAKNRALRTASAHLWRWNGYRHSLLPLGLGGAVISAWIGLN